MSLITFNNAKIQQHFLLGYPEYKNVSGRYVKNPENGTEQKINTQQLIWDKYTCYPPPRGSQNSLCSCCVGKEKQATQYAKIHFPTNVSLAIAIITTANKTHTQMHKKPVNKNKKQTKSPLNLR